MPKKRKFAEASKVLTVRVPMSMYNEYKTRFNLLLEGADKGLSLSLQELSFKAFKEIDNVFSRIRYILLDKGNISLQEYNNIIENTDLTINKKLYEYLKNLSINK